MFVLSNVSLCMELTLIYGEPDNHLIVAICHCGSTLYLSCILCTILSLLYLKGTLETPAVTASVVVANGNELDYNNDLLSVKSEMVP